MVGREAYSWYEPKPLRYLYFSGLLKDVVGIPDGAAKDVYVSVKFFDVASGQWLPHGAGDHTRESPFDDG